MKKNKDYIKLIKLLKKNGLNDDAINAFLNKKMDSYFGLTTNEFMKIDKKNIKIVIENINALLYGELMGA